MKKTTRDETGEITGTEFYCDNPKHKNDVRAFGQSLIHFWYGSESDMTQSKVHLCDDCAKEVLSFLKQKFGKAADLNEIIEF
jgi:hypothetical protein